MTNMTAYELEASATCGFDGETGIYWDGVYGTPSPADWADRIGVPGNWSVDRDSEFASEEIDEIDEIFADLNPGLYVEWSAGDAFVVEG